MGRLRSVRVLGVVFTVACGSTVATTGGAGGSAGGGAGGGGSAGAAGTGGAGSGGEMGGSGGVGGSAGEGGIGGTFGCPNGVVEADEECDDGNFDDTDGCTSECLVHCDCPVAGCVGANPTQAALLDPVTKHCYFRVGEVFSQWFGSATEAMQACQAWGGELATFQDQAELDFVSAGAFLDDANDYLVGGHFVFGMWTWDDATPWVFPASGPPWLPSEPVGGDCLEIYGTGALNADICDAAAWGYVCERALAGL